MTTGTLHSPTPACSPLWRVQDVIAWIRMLVSFWAFELASLAAFARAPRGRNGKARLMRLDVLALSNLLAVAEADLDWALARRACVLAGLDPDRVAHVQRSAPGTGAALIIRARVYCSRFFGFEAVAIRMAARMAKLTRRSVGALFASEMPGAPPALCKRCPAASDAPPARVAARVHGLVQPRAPP